jgi:hypothetical protein
MKKAQRMAKSMSAGIWVLCLSSAIFGMARPAAAGPVLYSQPSDYPNNFNGATSQNQGSGANWQTFDDFTLGATGTIQSITWQGFYWNLSFGPNPAPDNTISFEIGFFANVNNLPSNNPVPGGGPILLTGLQSAPVGPAVFEGDNVDMFNFSANLATSFTAQANTTYWLSIVSFSSSYPPAWIWASGQGPNNSSAQFNYPTQSFVYTKRDRAYSLSSSPQGDLVVGSPPTNPPIGQLADPVPEPGTLSLAAIAVLCAAGARFARRGHPPSAAVIGCGSGTRENSVSCTKVH